ncbi:MAG: ATP-NAD kinase family protein [Streptosporangiaceae bacterium]
MGDAIVGVVANPLSGRDIRRLVTQASVFPTAEKANMIVRMLTAFGAVGVQRVLVGTDLGGISAAVFRAVERRGTAGTGGRWPEVEFLDGRPIRQTAQDTIDAVRRMVTAGARVIVCLGGDGTARVAASAAGDVPMLALSTGTNNVFPAVREATVAGLAAGLVATGAVAVSGERAKVLEVRAGDRVETALVDVAVSTERHVGSRAIWDPATVTQIFCAFAEPDAVGLSSIAGQLCPVLRTDPQGVAVRLDPGADRRVLAPIAPGLVVPVGVGEVAPMECGTWYPVDAPAGVIAVDGERELAFGPGGRPAARPVVRLRPDGPRCVDVPAVLAAGARQGLLVRDRSSREAVR